MEGFQGNRASSIYCDGLSRAVHSSSNRISHKFCVLLIARLPPFLQFPTCLEKQYLILLRSCLCRPSSPNTSTVATPSRPQIRQVVKGTAE